MNMVIDLQWLVGINWENVMALVGHEAITHPEVHPRIKERKFLVDLTILSAPPEDLTYEEAERIQHGYMVIGENGSNARLNHYGENYSITVNPSADVSESSFETPLSEAQFSALWPATAGRRLEKTRYHVICRRQKIELDIYEGVLAGLATAEVLLNDEASATAFETPLWFNQDVTDNTAFYEEILVQTGVPAALNNFTPPTQGWRS